MPPSIRCIRVNHLNLVCEDFDAAVAGFGALYAAELMLDMPQKEWHACLLDIGRVIFEVFVPPDFLLGRRYGPHYLGIEYQADMDEVRQVIAAQNIRITRDIGVALHTHPADCFGVTFEFYGGSFHDNDWPLLGGKMKPAAYWRDEQALGLTGLKAYTVAVHDIEAAQSFFQQFLGAAWLYADARPAIAARAVGLQVADCVVELVTPVTEGTLQRHLHRFGEGIRSTVLGVRDIAQVQQAMAARGIALVPGGAPGSLAIPAESNAGVIFEFAA